MLQYRVLGLRFNVTDSNRIIQWILRVNNLFDYREIRRRDGEECLLTLYVPRGENGNRFHYEMIFIIVI